MFTNKLDGDSTILSEIVEIEPHPPPYTGWHSPKPLSPAFGPAPTTPRSPWHLAPAMGFQGLQMQALQRLERQSLPGLHNISQAHKCLNSVQPTEPLAD